MRRPAISFRSHPWRTLAVALAIVALGAVVTTVALAFSRNSLSDQLNAAQSELGSVTSSRDDLRERLDNRESQRRADEAAATRIAAERDAKQRRAEEEASRIAAQEAATQEAAAAARRTLPGSGIVAIGSEKDPGTYRTNGPASGGSCYYAVLSSPTGAGVDNIIDNNNVEGPAIVQLSPGQYFESSRCQPWSLQ